jgi:hypothetical protein
VTRGADDDGQSHGQPQAPKPPAGFDKFWDALQDVAPEGHARLDAVWNKGTGEQKTYVANHKKAEWKALRAKATAVKA